MTPHKAGSSAVFNITFKRDGKEKRFLQHGIFVFGHPSRMMVTAELPVFVFGHPSCMGGQIRVFIYICVFIYNIV